VLRRRWARCASATTTTAAATATATKLLPSPRRKAEGGGDATPMVRARHFDRALDNVLPSVSPKDERS